MYVTLKLLDINKAVNCNFKSTNTMFYCKSAGRQYMMSPHDIHKSLFPRTSRTILGPTSNSIQWGVFVHVHLVWRLRMYGVIPKLPPPPHTFTPFTRKTLFEMTRWALGPTQSPIHWGPGLFPGGLKQPRRNVHRSIHLSPRLRIIPGTARFFCVVVGLERGLLSLVSLLRSIEELLE